MFTLDINLMNRELTVDFMSFIVTTVMTMVIIWQTVKNARKQGETDRAIVEMQKEMHAERIDEAQYRYRMECISFVDEVMRTANKIAGAEFKGNDSYTASLMKGYGYVLATQVGGIHHSISVLWKDIDTVNLNKWVKCTMDLKKSCHDIIDLGYLLDNKKIQEIKNQATFVVAESQQLNIKMREQMINKRHAN